MKHQQTLAPDHPASLEATIRQLEQQNLLFDVAIENMSQGLCYFNGDRRLVFCNARYAEIYGLTEEMTRPGTTLAEIVERRYAVGSCAVDMTPEAYIAWRRAVQHSPKASDTIVQLLDGRSIAIHHEPMPDRGWVATHDDITERLRIEQTLRIERERFEAALTNMPDGLCMFDAEERLILCNDRYAEMYAIPKELTAPGTPLAAIINHRVAARTAPRDLQAYLGTQVNGARLGRCAQNRIELADGRVIQTAYRALTARGGWVSTHEDITEKVLAEHQINYMAAHDALTDLPNRVRFRSKLDEALGRVREGGSLAVLFLDLDHFKRINDTLGHFTGDALLQAAAERIRICLRPTDTVARFGGDEFAIIQEPIEGRADVAALAETLIRVLDEPFDLEDHRVVVGTSIGVAVAPHDSSDADQLLKSADMAVYRAKADGRAVFRFFEPEMDAMMQERRALEVDLRNALEQGEFRLLYQPFVDLESGTVSGFEALLRWEHPVRGFIAPAAFLAVADEIGLMGRIGAWVLRHACAEAARWPGRIGLAVNISAVQFKDRQLLLDVIAALGNSGLSPARLELEITEEVMLHDTKSIVSMLNQLREIGVRISVDDFGTGYSSLSYLQKFSFDRVKIDQSFVRELPSRADSRAIVRAITRLGADLGARVTAEGVETEEQLDMLRAAGCSEVQGYLFSRPLCPDRITETVETIEGRLRLAA